MVVMVFSGGRVTKPTSKRGVPGFCQQRPERNAVGAFGGVHDLQVDLASRT